MPKKTIIIISLLFLCIFIFADFVIADRELEINYPNISGTENIDETTDLPGFIKYIFNFIISIGGILAFGILIYSAVRLFLSAGNPQEISEAKSQIINAILGLAILFGSYTILTIINPNLIILNLSELNPFDETEPDPYGYENSDTKYYQEIPIGFLTENLLAKNINCFDNENNLVNCYNKEVILRADQVLTKINNFDPNIPNEPHPNFNDDFDTYREYANFCYDYDIDGIDGKDPTGDMKDRNGDKIITKEDLLIDHDRLDCIQKLAKAIQIKSQTIKDRSNDLKTETLKCDCGYCHKGWCSCDMGNYCQCTEGDPCPTRSKINGLRNDIYQIANGDEKKIPANTSKDPILKDVLIADRDPLFLDLREAKARMIGLRQELQKDLNDLKNAEKLTTENEKENSPYGQRMSLAEYEQKKSNKKIDKKEYKNEQNKNFNISEYCKNFNCIEYLEASSNICIKYGLNNGKLCNTYNLDGDGATLYFPLSPSSP